MKWRRVIGSHQESPKVWFGSLHQSTIFWPSRRLVGRCSLNRIIRLIRSCKLLLRPGLIDLYGVESHAERMGDLPVRHQPWTSPGRCPVILLLLPLRPAEANVEVELLSYRADLHRRMSWKPTGRRGPGALRHGQQVRPVDKDTQWRGDRRIRAGSSPSLRARIDRAPEPTCSGPGRRGTGVLL
jgi:hypothetical protein